jgi:hypothetical protein
LNDSEQFGIIVKFTFNNLEEVNLAKKRIGEYYEVLKVETGRHEHYYEKKRLDRLPRIMFILGNEKLSPGKLYCKVRKEVNMSYRSYQRDLSILILTHQITKEKNLLQKKREAKNDG